MQYKTLITIHLPMDMTKVGRLLKHMEKEFKGCVVLQQEATGKIEIVEVKE